ncbi:MAG: transporter substrate-binding protein [Pseudonocardiales bacterium]|nr:transporter substrate-binding protein [Pseudonocardiales bacterium]
MRVHKGKALVAGLAALALALTGCSSSKGGKGGGSNNVDTSGTKGTGMFADCAKSPNDCNTAKTKKGGSITYTLEKTLTGWNINSSNSNTFEFAEVMDGIVGGAFTANPDLKPVLNTDMMTSAEQTKASPQTLVYKIKSVAKWSDGQPIDVKDFQYQKDTSDGATCKDCTAASTAGYDQIASLTGSDNGKTVTVVMKKPYSDWQSMFGTLYPAHIAAQHGDLTTPAGLAASYNWLDKTQPTYSSGPYMVKAEVKDTSVTEVPNPKWYGAVKPSLDQLIFRIITEQTQEVPALQNNEVQAIYPQPNADIVTQAGGLQGVDSYLGKGLVWEHLDFNTTGKVLSDKVLRTAIFTAINRQGVIDKTIGQFVPGAKPLNNHMYVPGQPGYKDNVTATGQGSGDLAKAKKLLTDAGYTGVGSALKNKAGTAVSIRCSFTAGNTLRQQSCQLLQAQLGALGITVKPTPLDDLGGTLDSGDFDLIIFAWTGAPFVVAGAQQLFKLKGGGDYGKNNDPAVEALIDKSSTETDPANVQDDLNKADALLTADAYNLPLFQKPTFLAAYANLANIRDNATSSGPPYEVQTWGIRAS